MNLKLLKVLGIEILVAVVFWLVMWFAEHLAAWSIVRTIRLYLEGGFVNGLFGQFQLLLAMIIYLISMLVFAAVAYGGASYGAAGDKSAVNMLPAFVSCAFVIFFGYCIVCLSFNMFDIMRLFWWEGCWATFDSLIYFFLFVLFLGAGIAVPCLSGWTIFKRLKN